MKKHLVASLIASCGGLGYVPIMPGTVGSIGAMVVHYVARLFLSMPVLVGFGVCMTVIGFWATHRSIAELSDDDPSWIVIDEWCAMWLLCCVLPYFGWCYFLGCFIFRVFDIAKPWPVSLMERIPGASGVFLDDFLAAFLTAIFLCCVVIPVIL